jgi:hypothetical protein
MRCEAWRVRRVGARRHDDDEAVFGLEAGTRNAHTLRARAPD